MRYVLTTLMVACFALVTGCDSSGSEKYVGTWHRVKYPKETLTVSKEGGGKLTFRPNDNTSGEPSVGELIGDQVVFGATTASLRQNGNLVFEGREYTK